MKLYNLWYTLGLVFLIFFLYNTFLGLLLPGYIIMSLVFFILTAKCYTADENKKEPK